MPCFVPKTKVGLSPTLDLALSPIRSALCGGRHAALMSANLPRRIVKVSHDNAGPCFPVL